MMTLQYGVNLERFHPAGAGEERAPLVLSARALVPGKGIETVLRAARRLEQRGSALALELGVMRAGEVRGKLRRGEQQIRGQGRTQSHAPLFKFRP